MSSSPLSALRTAASEAARRSIVPFSEAPVGVALLHEDGRWSAGARIENPSFPLTIGAVVGAHVAAVAGDGGRIVAAACSRAFTGGERAFLADTLPHLTEPDGDDALTIADGALPNPTGPVGFSAEPLPKSDAAALRMAREAAGQALVPHSDFPVGAVVIGADGEVVGGCNVEYADWSRGLCGERVALARAVALGVRPAWIALSCIKSPGATPCGACRQVMAFLLPPDARVVIDHGDAPPYLTTPARLLPDAFEAGRLG
jgi:homotetrameric cytidine deaminase